MQAQAELIANLNQLGAPADGRRHRRYLGPDGRLEQVGRHRRQVRGVSRLPPGHGTGPQHRRARRRLRRTQNAVFGPAALPRELPVLPAAERVEPGAAPLPRAFPPHRDPRPVGQHRPRQHDGCRAPRSSSTSGGSRPAWPRSTSASSPSGSWPRLPQRGEEPRRGRFDPVRVRALDRVRPEPRRRDHRRLHRDRERPAIPASRATSWSYGGFLNVRPFGDMLVGARRQLRQLHQPPLQHRHDGERQIDEHASTSWRRSTWSTTSCS